MPNDQVASRMRAIVSECERIEKSAVPMRYRLQSADDLMNCAPLKWLVRGVLPAASLVSLFGPPGSGKTFLTLDLSMAVAAGNEWFGLRVTAAPVVYVALEGEAGLRNRMKAWHVGNSRPLPSGLRFITQPFDVRNRSDVNDLAHAILSGGGAGLLVLDTLNRAAPGADENSSRDMSEIIANLKMLQERLGGSVLAVHHTGKDESKGLRGHSSLLAALDAAVEVTRTHSHREWRVAKSKDDTDGERYPFALRPVDLGKDEHDESITSCVVRPDDSTDEVRRVKLPQGGNQHIALDALAEPLRQSHDFGKGDAPLDYPCLEIEAAVAIVAERLTCDANHRKQRAREAITGLATRKIFGIKDGWLWRK